MNEQVERRLEAESVSDSKGYITNGPFKRTVVAAEGSAVAAAAAAAAAAVAEPARWSMPPADFVVLPLASIGELLNLARPRKGIRS